MKFKILNKIPRGGRTDSVLSSHALKSEPVYVLDRNGVNFVKKCIQILETERISDEGIYRKSGVSHKTNQFIERNYVNLASSIVANTPITSEVSASGGLNHSNSSSTGNIDSSLSSNQQVTTSNNSSLLKHSNSFSTLNGTTLASSGPNATFETYLMTPQQPNSSTNNTATQRSATISYNLTPQQHSDSSSSSSSSSSSEDTCTVTSALKYYLIHLREPLMTFRYNQQFLDALECPSLAEKFSEIHRLLHSLPEINFELLHLLVRHLHNVSTHSLVNKMTATNLATCFGPTVFRAEKESVSNLYKIKYFSEIIEIFIVYNQEMFQSNRSLDSKFLNQLTPMRPVITVTHLSSLNATSTPQPPPQPPLANENLNGKGNVKANINSSIKRSGGPLSSQSYKNALINSSKISVSSSSDSSADYSNHSVNTSSSNNNGNYGNTYSNHLIVSSPILTSSPNNVRLNDANKNTSSSQRSTFVQSQQQTVPVVSITNSSLVQSPQIGGGIISNGVTPLSSLSSASNINSNKLSAKTVSLGSSNGTSRSLTPILNAVPLFGGGGGSNGNSLTGSSLGSNSSGISKIAQNSLVISKIPTDSVSNSSTVPQKGSNSMNSLNSNVGNYNNLGDLSALSFETSPSSSKIRRARTLYPCQADNPTELSFEANVIIYNVRRSKESGWLEATYNGKSGLVPGNYVQILED